MGGIYHALKSAKGIQGRRWRLRGTKILDSELPFTAKILAEPYYQNLIIAPLGYSRFMKLIDELNDKQEATKLRIHLIETFRTSSFWPTLLHSLEEYPPWLLLSQFSIRGYIGYNQDWNQNLFKQVTPLINFVGAATRSAVGAILRCCDQQFS